MIDIWKGSKYASDDSIFIVEFEEAFARKDTPEAYWTERDSYKRQHATQNQKQKNKAKWRDYN